MSSSVAYYVSAADLAARRQRELRAGIAGKAARLEQLRRRAAALGVTMSRATPKTHAGMTETALQTVDRDLDARVAEAERAVDAAWSERWRHKIAGLASTADQPASATAQLTSARSSATGSPSSDRDAVAKRRAIADARRLLAASGNRCRAADAAELSAVCDAMSEQQSLHDLRATALEISVRVKESIAEQATADAAALARARVHELLQDVLPEERGDLLAAEPPGDDLTDWEQRVHEAVARADLRKHRAVVASAVRRALDANGCELGEDFADLLIERGQAVVGLRRPTGRYGMIVKLPTDGSRLMTALVRAEGDQTDMAADLAVQQDFCDRSLPGLIDSLRADGVDLSAEPFHRTEPGARAMPVIAAAELPARRRRTTKPMTGATIVHRERRHGR